MRETINKVTHICSLLTVEVVAVAVAVVVVVIVFVNKHYDVVIIIGEKLSCM